jgi:hypothetical protein
MASVFVVVRRYQDEDEPMAAFNVRSSAEIYVSAVEELDDIFTIRKVRLNPKPPTPKGRKPILKTVVSFPVRNAA